MWIILIITLTLFIEHLMGRKLGKLTLFSTNSHGIIDFYTWSHITHGIIFYYIFSWFSIPWIFVLSCLVECLWEILENTPFIINRYRQTVSSEYEGDTIINSLTDIISMFIGIVLALYLPIWPICCIILILELASLYFVRDNLTLNIIMLIHPFEGIKKWQNKS